MNKEIETLRYDDEVKSQNDVRWLYKSGHTLGALFSLFLMCTASVDVGMVWAIAQTVAHFAIWPQMRVRLENRLIAVSFMTQTDNIYIFSKSQNTFDDPTAYETMRNTVGLLKTFNNKNKVKIHLALFGDVIVFTKWIDDAGNVKEEKKWREKGSATETWESYQSWCYQFEKNDRDARMRELRGGNSSKRDEWVTEKVFGQIF